MGDRGFTLIEVMAALVVAMLAGLATVTLMTANSRFLALNEERSDAIRQAQEVLEDLRTVAYTDIEAGSRTSDDGRYAVVWTVEEGPVLSSGGASEDGMKLITVSVTWNWHGTDQEYEMSTVYSEVNGSPTT
jgi:prepilin-type N-terminal cleavage/methylation domain-containing protein